MDEILLSALSENYAFDNASINLLKRETERCVYRVSVSRRADMIVRMYHVERLPEHVESQIATLTYLEDAGFAAPRVVRNRAGAPWTPMAGGILLVLSFVEGHGLGFDAASLESLGEVLSRLHSLQVTGAGRSTQRLPRSPFSPAARVPATLERLNSVVDQIPDPWRPAYACFKSTLEKCMALESLPLAIVHTDPFPGNAVRLSDGTVVLLDWDDAGLGHAIIDLGHALACSDADLEYAEDLQAPPERIISIAKGYLRHRKLSAAEREALPLATAFTPAEYGANHLVAAVSNSDKARWRWWWTRLRAASETARVALTCL